LHFKLFTKDGIHGIDPIANMAQAIAVGLAAEAFNAEFFAKGGHIKGVYETEQALGDELTDSEKAFRDMLNVDLTNKHVWGRTDILLKLHIAKGNKKVESLIDKIQKRVPSSKNTVPKSKQDKSDEKKVEEFYVQILESLFGFLVRMKGFAAESNFVTVRDTLEAISLDPTLNKSMIKDLGI
jgi:phage portal protein BeeE